MPYPVKPRNTKSPSRDLPAAGLLLTTRALLPSLNEQEQKVGQYILNHPEEVLHLAIGTLAQRCAVSDATVFRFCRRVGMEGYQDLKIRLAREVSSNRTLTYEEVRHEDPLAEAAQKAIAANVKALEDTLRVLDYGTMELAVDVLLGARRVDIYGAGGGAIAAQDLQYKLMRVGVRAVPHTDAETQIVSATLLTPADVAVAISHSGESEGVLRALQVAGEAGATTIAITNHPGSPVAVAAEIGLYTAAQEVHSHGYPLGARVAQVGLIDVLYACMAQKRELEVEQNHTRIAEALRKRQG
jgi:RpiR family transcriptional regulator, carbohydrate utilization regulator